MTPVRPFYFVVMGDSHIIDDYYVGPENTPLDSESIFKTSERLQQARDAINALEIPIDAVFHIGDYIHDYPSNEWQFYLDHDTRFDRAKAITDGFTMPFYVNFGNHDYAVPKTDRAFTHALFREKFETEPYYAVDHKGWKFVQLNNFLGETWNPKSDVFNLQLGSLGLEQLDWLEAELAQGQPTFLFVHFPLPAIQYREHLDWGLTPLLKKHQGAIQHIFSGHLHRWMEFSSRSGLPNLVIGSTRYDPNAYVIVEVDTETGHYRFLNEADWQWFTHYTVSSDNASRKNAATSQESPSDLKRIHRWR